MTGRPAVILGLTFLDNIFYELDEFPRPGMESFSAGHSFAVGGIAITAVNLAKLGVNTSLATSLGTDVFGDVLKARLKEADLQLTNFQTRDGRTNQSVAMVHGGERAFLTSLGDSPGERDLFLQWLTEHKTKGLFPWHLHIGLNGPDAWETIKLAKNQGMTVSVSLSHPSIQLLKDGTVSQADLWNSVSLVFLNEYEGEEITGSSGKSILASLSQASATSVITRGNRGAWLVVDSHNWFSCESLSVEVRDTTGAGDSFASGFLAGYLHSRTFEDCLAVGVACGSLSTTAVGGVDGFPRSFAEAERFAKTLKVCKLSTIDK